ncbi:MFS transporter [Enterococcus sp. HY326]|uniref:MFS transporter n=1 Tax=Enterococcus sp. HY326 TaxID=2971265 RepID=UPI00223ED2CB|nr:MFS transporter [Enterococcus sp. HY326]
MVGIENLFLAEDSLQIPAEKNFTKENPRSNFKLKKTFIWLLLGVACSYFGYSQLNSTIAQFLAWRSPEGGELYSLLLSLSAILIILLQFPILKISSQRSSASVLILSNLLFAGSLLTVLQFPKLFWLLLFIVGYSLAELFLGARFDYAVDQLAQEHEKGVYFSISEVVKIGSTLGPIVGGNLISLWGWHNSLPIFLLLAGLTVCGSFFLGRVERK